DPDHEHHEPVDDQRPKEARIHGSQGLRFPRAIPATLAYIELIGYGLALELTVLLGSRDDDAGAARSAAARRRGRLHRASRRQADIRGNLRPGRRSSRSLDDAGPPFGYRGGTASIGDRSATC